jgi:hypothetical protein
MASPALKPWLDDIWVATRRHGASVTERGRDVVKDAYRWL